MTETWIAVVVLWACVFVVPAGLLRIWPVLRGPGFAGGRWVAGNALVAGVPTLATLALSEPSTIRGLFVLPWVIFAASLSVDTLVRFVARLRAGAGACDLVELARVMATLYLPVGAAWLFAWAAGLSVLGFEGQQNLLTAAHFHYAGFGACALVGAFPVSATPWIRRLHHTAAALMIAGIALVAVGITVTQYTGHGAVEMIAAWICCAGIFSVAAMAGIVAREPGPAWRAVALSCAAFAALAAGSMALWYSFIGFTQLTAALVQIMVVAHGSLLAFGVVSLGLLALPRHATNVATAEDDTLPLSRLRGRGTVGARFFDEEGLVDDARVARGLCDRFADFASAHLDVSDVTADVAAFYEETDAFELQVVARWEPWMRLGGRIWSRLARSMAQLGLPLDTDRPEQIRSRLVALDATSDGRPGVRGWVRTRLVADGEEPIYIAAYAHHIGAGRPYMNIAFPLPRSAMTSVLSVRSDGHGGVLLTTLRDGAQGGTGSTPDATAAQTAHQGVYLSWGRASRVRLPLDETIRVCSCHEDAAWRSNTELPLPRLDRAPDLYATHDMWLFGFRYMRLEYLMWREAG